MVFCSSNALYSLSLSFIMFFLLLNPFNNWDCYLSLVWHMKKLLIKKECSLVLGSWRNIFPSCVDFIICLIYHWCNFVEGGRFKKKGSVEVGHSQLLHTILLWSFQPTVSRFWVLQPVPEYHTQCMFLQMHKQHFLVFFSWANFLFFLKNQNLLLYLLVFVANTFFSG